jgi:hypothetical protein
MKLINAVKASLRDNLLLDLMAALAASLIAALLTSLVNFQNQHSINIIAYTRFILLAVAAYSAIAIFLHQFWTGWLRRIVPNWVLIAFFGSLLFVCVRLAPGIIKGWYNPLRSESSFLNYISTEIDAARSVVIVLSFVTLPVAGGIYYSSKWIMQVKNK